MAEDVVVVGAGGFGRETLDVIEAINRLGGSARWRVLGVVDDRPSDLNLERLQARGYGHLGSARDVRSRHRPSTYVIGIGNPELKARIAAEFDAAGWEAATLLHPSAAIGSESTIESGAVVCAGVQLSTNVRVGRHVHLNPGAIVGHDAELEDFASVNPGAVISGEVTVGAGTLIGAGAVVLQGLRVGAASVVGASACVTTHVADRAVVAGVPARELGGESSG